MNAPTQGEAADDQGCGSSDGRPCSPARKEKVLLKPPALPPIPKQLQVVEKVRAKTGWDERILHAPADVGMFVASIITVSPFGIFAVLALVTIILLAAILFT